MIPLMINPFEINPWLECPQTATQISHIFNSLDTFKNINQLQGKTPSPPTHAQRVGLSTYTFLSSFKSLSQQ